MYAILPLSWGSRDMHMADLVSLYTLGLAPLIVHIISGVPSPSYLCHRRPRWHEKVVLCNPTSILWRYAAITDRRIRSGTWSNIDIAATNALFWTPQGWDGTDSMVQRCLPYASHLPRKSRVDMLSLEMVKNVVVFLQFVQAVAALANNFSEFATYTALDAVNGLFIPLAICGLFRLFAAPWLTNDYTFTINAYSVSQEGNLQLDPFGSKPIIDERRERRLSIDSLIDHHIRNGTYLDPETDDVPKVVVSTPSPVQIWGSKIFRVAFIIPFLCAFSVCFMYLTPLVPVALAPRGVWTISSWLVSLFYTTIVTPSIAIYGYYFIRGEIQRTTIIPCISTTWYKVYSIFVMVFMGVLLTVSGIETRKTVCGAYTTLLSKYGDPCARGGVELYQLGSGTMGLTLGLAQNLTGSGRLSLFSLNGYCLGVPGQNSEWQEGTLLNYTS
ncbi:hypothetical protein VP1G_03043 [Cytospora mali]|uniref:Uncharacterized protein n=1 Tax=Cytospora mali TaxID=578113 RepID=A0A194UVR1_CYTMA|nr:hypothetical protein VP1G_03043 [Valsa mali var. pyri (nom. inval.)]